MSGTILFICFVGWLVYEWRKPNPTRGKSGDLDTRR